MSAKAAKIIDKQEKDKMADTKQKNMENFKLLKSSVKSLEELENRLRAYNLSNYCPEFLFALDKLKIHFLKSESSLKFIWAVAGHKLVDFDKCFNKEKSRICRS